MNRPEPRDGSGLVLLAPGGLAAPAAPASLAALLGLRLLAGPAVSAAGSPPQLPGPADDPALVLAALAGQPPGWLLPLPIDPGQELNSGGCWAEALGAWRQPALLLIPPHAPAGAPRAYSALLQSVGVPLLGLVQLGGAWDPEIRRRDGLPWLGWQPAPDARQAGAVTDLSDDAAADLRAACRRRWREVSAARPAAPPFHPPGAAGRPA